ncbi:SecDF P1 head subdomain-containing protein [Ensifer adhaerens]|uniref:SecDF P1 head subdomain-containing protein n=1 Tax=Ensifer adhaerens TaxID=106592 RepID=UPI0011782BBB|nr:hypothetical protein [Ensifer adhaerens]
MHRTFAVAILLNALALMSPAAAETIRLHVESGAIVGIKDRHSGRLEVYLTEQSAQDLWVFTGRHVGKTVEILVDGEVIASPIIRDAIMGPSMPIPNSKTDAERRETIARLTEGSMALELRLSAE